MRHHLVVIAVLCSLLTEAWARMPQDDVEFRQQPATLKSDYVRVGITLKNVSGHFLRSAYVDCAALGSAGDVIETGVAGFSNLKPGETAYEFVNFLHIHQVSMDFICRVDSVNRGDD